MSLIQFSDCYVLRIPTAHSPCTSDRCTLQSPLCMNVRACRCQESNVSWRAAYRENGPLVQTSQGWKGKGEKGEKGRPLVFLFSVFCNPHVKTVRAKVGCRLHRLAFPFLDTQCPHMCPPWEHGLCAAIAACRWLQGQIWKDNLKVLIVLAF